MVSSTSLKILLEADKQDGISYSGHSCPTYRIPCPESQIKGPRWSVPGSGSHIWVSDPEPRAPDPTFPVCRLFLNKGLLHIYISNICIPYCSRKFVHTDIVVCFAYPIDRIFASIKLHVGAKKTLQSCIQACFPKGLQHICSLAYVRIQKYFTIMPKQIMPKCSCSYENVHCVVKLQVHRSQLYLIFFQILQNLLCPTPQKS